MLNHKNKEKMFFAYENAGKMNTETRKRIEEVVENCKICKANSRLKSKPSVKIPRATDFNGVGSRFKKVRGQIHIVDDLHIHKVRKRSGDQGLKGRQ